MSAAISAHNSAVSAVAAENWAAAPATGGVTAESLRPGVEVIHLTQGVGTLQASDGSHGEAAVVVLFDSGETQSYPAHSLGQLKRTRQLGPPAAQPAAERETVMDVAAASAAGSGSDAMAQLPAQAPPAVLAVARAALQPCALPDVALDHSSFTPPLLTPRAAHSCCSLSARLSSLCAGLLPVQSFAHPWTARCLPPTHHTVASHAVT